jgi:hypothetical protein
MSDKASIAASGARSEPIPRTRPADDQSGRPAEPHQRRGPAPGPGSERAECVTSPEVEWFPRRAPGQLASDVRATRDPLPVADRPPFSSHPAHVQEWLRQYGFNPKSYDAGLNTAGMPLRVDPAAVRSGDTFGAWAVVDVHVRRFRVHGHPCHCFWGIHGSGGDCSHDDPRCPCHRVETRYQFSVQCECGRMDWLKDAYSLCSGASLSCGHCLHRSPERHDLAVERGECS